MSKAKATKLISSVLASEADYEINKSSLIAEIKGATNEGSSPYVQAVLSTVHSTLKLEDLKKHKNPTVVYLTMMMLKDCLDANQTVIANQLNVNSDILHRLGEIAKFDHANPDPDRGRAIFGGRDPDIGSTFLQLVLECLYQWKKFKSSDGKPTVFTQTYEDLLKHGVTFPRAEDMVFYRQKPKKNKESVFEQSSNLKASSQTPGAFGDLGDTEKVIAKKKNAQEKLQNIIEFLQLALINEGQDLEIIKDGLAGNLAEMKSAQQLYADIIQTTMLQPGVIPESEGAKLWTENDFLNAMIAELERTLKHLTHDEYTRFCKWAAPAIENLLSGGPGKQAKTHDGGFSDPEPHKKSIEYFPRQSAFEEPPSKLSFGERNSAGLNKSAGLSAPPIESKKPAAHPIESKKPAAHPIEPKKPSAHEFGTFGGRDSGFGGFNDFNTHESHVEKPQDLKELKDIDGFKRIDSIGFEQGGWGSEAFGGLEKGSASFKKNPEPEKIAKTEIPSKPVLKDSGRNKRGPQTQEERFDFPSQAQHEPFSNRSQGKGRENRITFENQEKVYQSQPYVQKLPEPKVQYPQKSHDLQKSSGFHEYDGFEEKFENLSVSTLSVRDFPLKNRVLKDPQRKTPGKLIPYNPQLFDLEYLRENPSNLRKFKQACLKSKCPLFEIPGFQVGILTSVFFDIPSSKNYLKMAIYYGNKSKYDLEAFSVDYTGDYSKPFFIKLQTCD